MDELENLTDDVLNRTAAIEVMTEWVRVEDMDDGRYALELRGFTIPDWNPCKNHNHAQMLAGTIGPLKLLNACPHNLLDEICKKDWEGLQERMNDEEGRWLLAAITGLMMPARTKTIAAILASREVVSSA